MKASMQSFFERAPDEPCRRGRILLISYHFPPGQAAGAVRWQKLAQHAFERGWGLDVITLDPPDLLVRDDSVLADLPRGIRVFGVPEEPLAIERLEHWLFAAVRDLRSRAKAVPKLPNETTGAPAVAKKRVASLRRDEVVFSLAAPRTWARAYWAWLEFAREGAWARRAAAAAREIVDRDAHRFVISCGPPHMVHLAAHRLSRELELPMLMDMRDPWSLNERTPEPSASPLWYWLARHYERRAVRQAALVTMNTEPASRAMQRAHPERSDSILAVPNAFDERPVPSVERDPRFLIAYAGTIYLDRTPLTLFEAAAELVRELSLSPEELGIEFMGYIDSVDGESIDDIAARVGLSGYVRTHPPAPYAVAERFLASAAMLLSLPQDSHLAIPSKIYDCMRFEARLLAFAEPESAIALLLRDTNAAVVAANDVAGVLEVLRDAYGRHVAGERVAPIARDPRFSRRAAAQRMFDAIDRVLSADPDRSTPDSRS
jgi:glycosyltransferase involved in cell wall biosynthesis